MAVEDPAALSPHVRATSHRPGLLSLVVALVVALGAAAAAFALVSQRTPSYYAAAATLLDQPTAIAASQDSGVVDKLGRLRFKYAGIVRSDTVVDAAATDLNLPPATVAGRIVTLADPDSLLLLIGATAGSGAEAQRTANELARQLASYVDQEQSDARIAARDRISLRTVAPARSAQKVSPTHRQRDTAGLGAGLAGFAVALGVADVLRRRRR